MERTGGLLAKDIARKPQTQKLMLKYLKNIVTLTVIVAKDAFILKRGLQTNSKLLTNSDTVD